jgi:FkbM family methyltransferase
MDPVGAAIRVGRRYSPRLAAEANWLRNRKSNPVHRAVDHLVQRGSTAVDIGASRGDFTARLLRLVGRRGFVYAIEPNPMQGAQLRRIGRPANLGVHIVALSDTRGVATLRVPIIHGRARSGLGSLETPASKGQLRGDEIRVPIMPMVDLLTNLDRLDFMKCDVEGHERAVLAGGRQLLDRYRPAVVIEIEQRHQDSDVNETFQFFEDLGYRGWAFFSHGVRPLSAFDLERDQLRFIRVDPTAEFTPPEYVHNFIVTMPRVSIEPQMDPLWEPRRSR